MTQVVLTENMTLDEKLAAIDAALAEANLTQDTAIRIDTEAITDPSELVMCLGCQ